MHCCCKLWWVFSEQTLRPLQLVYTATSQLQLFAPQSLNYKSTYETRNMKQFWKKLLSAQQTTRCGGSKRSEGLSADSQTGPRSQGGSTNTLNGEYIALDGWTMDFTIGHLWGRHTSWEKTYHKVEEQTTNTQNKTTEHISLVSHLSHFVVFQRYLDFTSSRAGSANLI